MPSTLECYLHSTTQISVSCNNVSHIYTPIQLGHSNFRTQMFPLYIHCWKFSLFHCAYCEITKTTRELSNLFSPFLQYATDNARYNLPENNEDVTLISLLTKRERSRHSHRYVLLPSNDESMKFKTPITCVAKRYTVNTTAPSCVRAACPRHFSFAQHCSLGRALELPSSLT